VKRVIHGVMTITHTETFCGRRWRHEPNLYVETKWERVSCKQCLPKITDEENQLLELERVLERLGLDG